MERIKVIDGFKKQYVIPCFQREYSWEDEEIEELIKNMGSVDGNDDYCMGIVVVQNNNHTSLLIDGQQRLTTLYLIGIYCGLFNSEEDILLTSEYEKIVSNSNNLVKILQNKLDEVPKKLENGYRIVADKITEENREKYKSILKKLYYYEIDIDKGVDLNHYFEVMNSRGVQLSRSDIIKAYLMEDLDEADKARLNHLWYSCETMDSKKFKYKKFSDFSEKKLKSNYKSINKILDPKNIKNFSRVNNLNNDSDDDSSILNFDYFLLYIIRIYKNRDSKDLFISGEFDLNDLISEYEDLFNSKKTSKEVIDFLDYMVLMKNIYDKYIVKYDNNSETWSLSIDNEKMKSIQACLRVSFINRRIMPWIYMTLKYFYNICVDGIQLKNATTKDINKYILELRNYIRENYLKNFLDVANECEYRTGVNYTPNIVLNYLDLLIKENYKNLTIKFPEAKELIPKEFTFKFRNSIEHFKPRHDRNGKENPKWVDDFGNLALLAYGTNTKMQNAEPDEKAKHFAKDLSGYSLKLQIMSQIALNEEWGENCSYRVRDAMIELIKEDLLSLKK